VGNEPIKRKLLSDEIAERILNDIKSGALLPGEKIISERELGEKYQVSRTVVRETLKGLIFGGTLEKRADGTYVRENFNEIISGPVKLILNSGDISVNELYQARIVLEMAIIKLTIVNATEEDFKNMKKYIDILEDKNSSKNEKISSFNESHRCIAEATHNNVISNVYKLIYQLLYKVPRAPLNVEESAKAHKEIYESICARDIKRAEAAILNHMKTVAGYFGIKKLFVDDWY